VSVVLLFDSPGEIDPPLAPADLDHVLSCVLPLWDILQGRRVFMTGGTGFVGGWMLESLAWAVDKLRLDCRATVLTRDPVGYAAKRPYLATHDSIRLLEGDVLTFTGPSEHFDFVVHAASQELRGTSPEDLFDKYEADVAGTRRVADFARQSGVTRFLLTSSGAVYGRQPPDLRKVTEDYAGAPDPCDPSTAYGQAKRVSEFTCASLAQTSKVAVTIARCFAFVGPLLPLDAGYAVGNFLRDALEGRPIEVTGDGRSLRSYLHAADLAVWLWTILLKGRSCRPYNVGSDADVSILELARTVARVVAPDLPVTVKSQATDDGPPPRYVPSVQRAREELGLTQRIGLDEAVRRTAAWHLKRQARPCE
jgi:nucleoside-diphosphate-sugar epimerase